MWPPCFKPGCKSYNVGRSHCRTKSGTGPYRTILKHIPLLERKPKNNRRTFFEFAGDFDGSVMQAHNAFHNR
jgi:hypothetical protein